MGTYAGDTGLLDLWAWHQQAAGHSDRTVHQRVKFIRSLATMAGTEPADLTAAHLIRYLSRDLSPWSKRTYFMHGRAWFRWLHAQGYRESDETAALPVPKAPRVVPRPMAPEALEQVIRTAGPRASIYLTLAAFAGLRACEIAAVRGSDVTDRRLVVNGKGSVMRFVPLHPRVATVADRMPTEGYWFPGKDHGHVSPKAVSQTVTKNIKKAGVSGTLHRGRHWFGTSTLRSSGGNIRVTQELLGHASPATTAGYTMVDDDERSAAVLALPDFMAAVS